MFRRLKAALLARLAGALVPHLVPHLVDALERPLADAMRNRSMEFLCRESEIPGISFPHGEWEKIIRRALVGSQRYVK